MFFCNSVDNALIQFDAQKLNISVANSMLASVAYNDDTGVWTFKTLAGTTYTFNQNIEKIPVSFTLTEDGVLVMTTEDGTEWECNIADLIKDYVFDDSETVAFEKEFIGTDDGGKGSYHVTASVKNGSITADKLNPDYRADILTYKTQAQEAANDSLTYSKDSQRWAVGSAEYEGSATDNAKYYKEQAEAAKAAAEEARDEAQAATGAVIATTTQLGVVKPDGTTIGVEEDGTIKSIIKAASLLITDNQELVVEKQGEVAQETTTQALIDAIADKVANQLVTNTALTSQLANYVTKAMMSNVQVNDQNKVPTSALAYAMQQQITENENAISVLNSDLNSRNDVSDLLAEADMGRLGKRIVICGMNTLNTPYKAGLTPGAEGVAYINMTNDNYGTILFIVSGGDDVFCRYKHNGTWSPEWSKFVTNADIADSQATIALNSSQDFFTSGYNYISRFGKVRVLRIYMTAVHGSTASTIQIGSLESGDRPRVDAYGIIQNDGGSLSCMCSAAAISDGRILIRPLQELSADVIVGGTLTWITN